MLMMLFLLLFMVIDILVYYTFPERYRYGVCFEMVKMPPLYLVVIIFYALMMMVAYICKLWVGCVCVCWPKGSNVNINAVTIIMRQDDEPALLIDNDEDQNDGTDTESNENSNNGGSHGNYIRNITENQNFGLNGKIKTSDEVVEKMNERSTEEENKE